MEWLRSPSGRRFLLAAGGFGTLLTALYLFLRTNLALLDTYTLNVGFGLTAIAGFLLAVYLATISPARRLAQPGPDAALAHDLSQAREWLNGLLEHVSVGVVIVGPNGEVLLTNPLVADLFAVSAAERQASTLSQLLRHFQFVELWRQAVQTNTAQSLTAEVPQSHRHIRARVFPLRGTQAGNAVMVLEDITELRRLETIRRDFVSNVSHELRTPLTSLKALTESLRAGALDEPETAQRFLALIETEVDALSELVAELLELAKIESARVPLQIQPSDPCAIIQRAADRLKLQVERAGLTLTVECPPDTPAVPVDAFRLEQVLVNLLHNAIKFTPDKGQIGVGVETLPGESRFYVRDTGVGIPAENLSRVFERFYKTDQARSARAGARSGTGLGLAISKHIVEAHGSRIWAESVVGEGSTFYFSIPGTGSDTPIL